MENSNRIQTPTTHIIHVFIVKEKQFCEIIIDLIQFFLTKDSNIFPKQ